MDYREFGGHLVKPHSQPDLQHSEENEHVEDQVECEALQDPRSNSSKSTSGFASTTSTTASPRNIASSSHASRQVERETNAGPVIAQNAFRSAQSEIHDAEVHSSVSMPLKVTDFHAPDSNMEPATTVKILQGISGQLEEVEKGRRKEEDNGRHLEQRIKSAELAHGQQLQQLSALQDAVERRGEQIRNYKEAHQNSLSLQQKAHQRAEELRNSLTVIAAKLDEDSFRRRRD